MYHFKNISKHDALYLSARAFQKSLEHSEKPIGILLNEDQIISINSAFDSKN